MNNLLVLKPYILSIINWWKKRKLSVATLFQDFIVVILLIVLLVSIFSVGKFTLGKISEYSDISYLSASTVLSIILFFLFFMSFFSALAINIGVFFFSSDSSLLAASPIKSYKLYFGKTTLVFVASSWMPLFFIAPFILSFSVVYKTSYLYLIPAFFILILLFLLTNFLAQIFALLLIKVSFLWSRKVFLLIIPVIIVLLIYSISNMLYEIGGEENALLAFSKIYQTLQFSNNQLLPSMWASKFIGNLLEFSKISFLSEVYLLLSVTLFSSLSAYFLWELSSSSINAIKQVNSIQNNEYKILNNLIKKITTNNYSLAIIAKDLLLLSRDIAQLMQIAVLSFISFLYLSHIQLLEGLNFFPPDKILFWRGILSISNVLLATFFCTAICTRLVFPSVSLEGKSYWIIKTAPISSYNFLLNKLKFWYFPLCAILILFLGLGTYLLNYSLYVVLVYVILAIFLSFSITGIAVGLGAKYANFNYEYSGQMAMSFGSLIFMLTCVALSVLSQIPIVILLNLVVRLNFSILSLIIFISVFLLLCLILYKLAFDCIKIGSRSLVKD